GGTRAIFEECGTLEGHAARRSPDLANDRHETAAVTPRNWDTASAARSSRKAAGHSVAFSRTGQPDQRSSVTALDVGSWRLEVGCWRFDVRCWAFDVRFWLGGCPAALSV